MPVGRADRGASGDQRQRRGGQSIQPFPSVVTPTKTAAYTARYGELVRVDPTGGAVTITAPLAKGCAGQLFGFKNVSDSTNAITVDAQGAERVEDDVGLTSTAARRAIIFCSDGTDWLAVWDYGDSSTDAALANLGQWDFTDPVQSGHLLTAGF